MKHDSEYWLRKLIEDGLAKWPEENKQTEQSTSFLRCVQ